ncbi:MAG: glycoside hydrolase family 2 protein [Bacteroidales bacterium]|nr:glycoside hydrolase family 2 protein [Bacteroidales bacterium]
MKRIIPLLILALAFVACQKVEKPNVVVQSLNQGWTLTSDTLSISIMPVTVPSVVQQSLYENGIIPHPYLGTVENELLWISDHPWDYTLHFDVDKELFEKQVVELEFEGIDTYAEVSLNSYGLFSADNQFREWKADVKPFLEEKDNLLEVHFVRYDSTQMALYEQHQPQLPEKYAVSRKAPYQHGWDWAPKYKNVGIWKPVKLVGWNEARLENAYIVTQAAEIGRAELMLHLDVESVEDKDVTVEIGASIGSATLSITQKQRSLSLSKGRQHTVLPIIIDNPQFWWPNEMGEQSLYVFDVVLKDGDKILDFKKICSGIKTIEMVDEPDGIGRAFYFKVNDEPFYAKGANYIPEEMIETWVNPDNTLRLLREAKDAHFNMLRVWGGGVYPSDDFFNICDSLGIMVWEDFMYAGSMYPYDEAFLKNAQIEAEEQARRLGAHPSLALWCGGNEISEGYYNWGWQQSLNWSEEDDKAIKAGYDRLFEDILPQSVTDYDATRPYWSSSPSKGWGRPESLTEGDVHYWGVWWGELPYEIYREKVGRFNSEYGYQSYPDYQTLLKIAQSEALSKDAEVVAAHQKHARGTRQIDDFIRKYYPYSDDFEEYVYLSQLSQAYGMEIAIEAHRTAKPYNMGTLYWQLNDAWPVTSWSSIDYYGNKKALQYKLKTLYAPVLLSLDPKDHGVFVTSDLMCDLKGNLKVKVVDFERIVLFEKAMNVQVPTNGNEKFQIEGLAECLAKADKTAVYVKLELVENENLLSERYCYLAYPKDLKLPKAHLEWKVSKENGQTVIEVSTDAFAKEVQVYCTNGMGGFSDNFFDLEAGQTKRIVFEPALRQAQGPRAVEPVETPDLMFGVRCLNGI